MCYILNHDSISFFYHCNDYKYMSNLYDYYFIGVALLNTIIVTIFMRFLKPKHEEQQIIIVFFFSYLSFEVADALSLSGITSSLFSGIFMGYLVPKVHYKKHYADDDP